MPAAHPTTRQLTRYTLFALLLALLLAFLVWPILLTVRGGFQDPGGGLTVKYLYEVSPPTKTVGIEAALHDGLITEAEAQAARDAGEAEVAVTQPGMGVLQDPLYRQGLGNSLLIAALTTGLCLLITLPMSVIAARYEFPGKAFVSALVLVPLILPPFVGAIGMRALLGRFGAINALLGYEDGGIDFLGGAVGGQLLGVVVMEALHLYPILYLNITAALANLDPSLDEAAQNLGAGRWKRFWRCTFPLILPGVFAGTTIVFIWSFTELGTPLMFDYYAVTPVQVFWGLNEVAENPRPYALVVVMLVVAVALYALGKLAFGGRAYAMQGKATAAVTIKRLRGAGGLAAAGLFLGVTFLAILPHLGVILASVSGITGGHDWYNSVLPKAFTLEHYDAALSHPLAMGSIANSLLYAIVAMVLCSVVGLAIAYLVVRVRIRGGFLLDTMGMLPLAVPGLVMAFGYVAMSLVWPFAPLTGRDGAVIAPAPLEGFSVLGQDPNPFLFLVIAYAVRRLPYILRSASAGLEQTSGELEEAALNLGAKPLYAIRRVVVPLIMANLIAGGILVFSFAMLEVSDSLILATKEKHYPITKAIWTLYNRLGDGQAIASAMGVWGMALLTITLVGASVLMGRKLGAIFRV